MSEMRESKKKTKGENEKKRKETKIWRTYVFCRKENSGEVTLIAVSTRTYGKRSSYLAFP